MHRFRAQVNTSRPLNAAKIRVDCDGVENICIKQLQKYAAALSRFDVKYSAHPVIENDLQLKSGKQFD
jgi:hypothetical protein